MVQAQPYGREPRVLSHPDASRSRTWFASTTVVTFFLSPPGDPGDLPCPAKGAAIKSHDDEDQSTLQRSTPGVRQERCGEAELR